MAAVFHGLGRCFMFAKFRTLYNFNGTNYTAINGQQGWIFIGTAITSPDVQIRKITTPITTDKLGPAPANRLYHSEIHIVTATINMMDYTNYLGLKARGTEARGGILRGDPKDYIGTLMTPVEDVELLLLWDALTGATDTPLGRRYFSATPLVFRETTENTRVLESSVSFECKPILLKEYKPPIPPNPPPATVKKIVPDFPDPNRGTKITADGITVNGMTFTPDGFANYLNLTTNVNPNVRPVRRPAPPEPVSPSTTPSTTSPIPSDKYLYYLYTEIVSLF